MDVRERNFRFWSRAVTDRPLVAAKVGTFAAESFQFPFRSGLLRPESVRPEPFLGDYDRSEQMSARLNEDLFMVAIPYWGIPWMEAIIGCPIQVDSGTASMWATPRSGTFNPEDLLPAPSNPWLERLLEFTDALVARAAGRYPVSLTLMRGPLDMVSGLLGHNRMCALVLDDPARLKELMQACTQVWLQVARAQWARIPRFEGGFCCGMRRVWAPGTTALNQEDASVLISPRAYADLVLESDSRIFEAFEYPMMHLHSAGLHVIDSILGVRALRAVEVDIDPGGPPVSHMLPVFRKIQEVTSLHLYGELAPADIRSLLNTLDHRGLCLEVRVATEAQARQTLGDILRMMSPSGTSTPLAE
jgi:hypothetical protein